jgi:hypothetical protein
VGEGADGCGPRGKYQAISENQDFPQKSSVKQPKAGIFGAGQLWGSEKGESSLY